VLTGAANIHSIKGSCEGGQVRLPENGELGPRFGLFLFDCIDAASIRETLQRIPRELEGAFEEVVVMLDSPSHRRRFDSENASAYSQRARGRIRRGCRHARQPFASAAL